MIKISVCIPVYNTEQYLMSCISSVYQAASDFTDYEILVCNDGSPGTGCKEICEAAHVKYLEHTENKGLLEARRTLVTHASGEFILMLDSDDIFLPRIFTPLYDMAKYMEADIVQGVGNIRYTYDPSEVFERARHRYWFINTNRTGILLNDKILYSFVVRHEQSCYLSTHLIKRDLYLKALSCIPETYIVMSEDWLQYYFICKYAKKYLGIPLKMLNYTIDTGITMPKAISSLHKWKQICSVANVEKIIMASKPLPKHLVALQCAFKNAYNRTVNWLDAVIPELKEQAKQIIEDYFK